MFLAMDAWEDNFCREKFMRKVGKCVYLTTTAILTYQYSDAARLFIFLLHLGRFGPFLAHL